MVMKPGLPVIQKHLPHERKPTCSTSNPVIPHSNFFLAINVVSAGEYASQKLMKADGPAAADDSHAPV